VGGPLYVKFPNSNLEAVKDNFMLKKHVVYSSELYEVRLRLVILRSKVQQLFYTQITEHIGGRGGGEERGNT
jgi:hypothetical protein